MRSPLGVVAAATVMAFMGLQAGPVAAQTFDERWPIIPNALTCSP
jgi:hypothetical protein